MKKHNAKLKNTRGNEKIKNLGFLFTFFIFSFFIFNFHLNFASADITTGLVSHYKLDETSGTIADDSVGTNNGTGLMS